MAQVKPNVSQKLGYRRLAEWMAWSPAHAIFPRFQACNMLNLLYLQAEVTKAEVAFNLAAKLEDSNGHDYSSNWQSLMHNGKDSPQWEAFKTLKVKLEAYNEAVMTQIAMLDQPGPKSEHYDYLDRWLFEEEGGCKGSLRGPGSLTWSPKDGGRPISDQMAIGLKYVGSDAVTRWASRNLSGLFNRLPLKLKKRSEFLSEEGDSFVMYGTPDSVTTIGDRLLSILATVMILVPIIVLHFLKNENARLIVIVCFSVAFTAVLVMATDARRTEVFGASAAFVAVLVVYVGSALNLFFAASQADRQLHQFRGWN